ncbi:hypothetical protein IFM89_021600 [Coptis chinensis]|uniref:FAR1 domain-containing protein n=1 Tax=Coptis chinensis TaxID=261450 RepID=A0A835ID93_9MAGN|nr:hypothetical protein IFM89_021600 [Coptis chinensis]
MEEEGRQDVVRDVNMLENDSNSSKSDSYDDGVEILDEQMEEESEVVVKGVISLEMAKGGCEEGKKDNVEVEVNGKDKQVDDNVEEERNESYPRVGMEFKSQEEAYEFYCWYAMKTGFKVRKNSTCRSRRSNQVIGRNYVCSRQGVKDHSRESTRDMPLSEFVTLFEKSVIFERGKEYNADSESNNGSPSLRFAIDIEKEAAKIYTKEIFQKFQDQLSEGICYRHKKEAINIAAKGSASTEAFKIAILCLHNAMKEVEAALKKDSTERTACNINVVSGNKDNTTVGRVEKSLENQSTPFVLPTVKQKGRPKGLKPRGDKLPVKKMSVTKKTPSKPHTLVSSQISFAAPNKNAYEPQQNRGKFGQNLQLKIAVENDQFQRSKRPAVPNPISNHQSENMASHSYYQPSARELEFHTLSHASPATEDLSNFTQSYYMNDTHPFSLVSPTQHFHCLNQDSSVVGQSLGISQHDGLVANSSYLRRYQLGQGNPPAFVISPHQSQGNTSIDLNGPNRDL